MTLKEEEERDDVVFGRIDPAFIIRVDELREGR
jgi:hypothetical protein